MPRRSQTQCYWTRNLELDLVNFVREREFIWKANGNTNHHIQQKYKAYAEFASKLGPGFTARSVRDRWVNIRSTYNHNLRRVDKSKEISQREADIYVPCWPLWKPLQFLRNAVKKENGCEDLFSTITEDFNNEVIDSNVKQETTSNIDDEVQDSLESDVLLEIRQDSRQTNRPRRRHKTGTDKDVTRSNKCTRLVDDLVKAVAPLTTIAPIESNSYWFFGKHVTERLNAMRECDAECASKNILNVLEECMTIKVEMT